MNGRPQEHDSPEVAMRDAVWREMFSLPSFAMRREIGDLLPNNQRQRRTCYALCDILYPVSAAHTSIFRMDSNSTS